MRRVSAASDAWPWTEGCAAPGLGVMFWWVWWVLPAGKIRKLIYGFVTLDSVPLDPLFTAARERGDNEVMLHAQCSAEGFYTRQGFVTRGSTFEEAGIQHVEMVLPLV